MARGSLVISPAGIVTDVTYVRRIRRTGASWRRRLREGAEDARRAQAAQVLDEIIPNLDLRDDARRVAWTDGLHLGPTKIFVSTILMPNMDRATARHVPPYRTTVFKQTEGEPIMEWTSWNRAAAEACHRDVVDMHRYIQRARMRRCRALYRRRRR